MSCPCNSTSSAISCDEQLPVMGGATIPQGVTAVEIFIGDTVEWDANPPQPALELPVLLVNQSEGGILIDEEIYLAI